MNNIPEIINGCNVYVNGSSRINGISDAIALPNPTLRRSEVNGAGMMGSYETASPGNYENMEQAITIRLLTKESLEQLAVGEIVDLTIRASAQVMDPYTGKLVNQKIRVVERGLVTSLTPGNIQNGDGMGTSFTISLRYLRIDIDGERMIEIDVINCINYIGGKDVYAEIRKNI